MVFAAKDHSGPARLSTVNFGTQSPPGGDSQARVLVCANWLVHTAAAFLVTAATPAPAPINIPPL